MLSNEQKFETHNKIFEGFKEQKDGILVVVNPLLKKAKRLNQEMETLDRKYHELLSLKEIVRYSSEDLESYRISIDPECSTFDRLTRLSSRYASELENDLGSAIAKAKILVELWLKSIPEFDGTFSDWEPFKDHFMFITGTLGTGSKRTRLKQLSQALKGDARERFDYILRAGKPFNEIWKALDDYYGSQRNMIDVLVSSLFSLHLQEPPTNIYEIANQFNSFKMNTDKILSLGYTLEELLVAYYLLQLPWEFRERVETELKPLNKYKYNFSDIQPVIDKICI